MLGIADAGLTVVALLIVVLIVALPIKIGAHVVSAQRRGVLWCFLASVVGVFAGNLAAVLFGGLLGGPLAAAVGFVIGIRFILGTTFVGAIGVAIVAWGVSLLAAWFLLRHAGYGAADAPGIAI